MHFLQHIYNMHLTFYEREQFSHLQKSILKRNKHYITLHYITVLETFEKLDFS